MSARSAPAEVQVAHASVPTDPMLADQWYHAEPGRVHTLVGPLVKKLEPTDRRMLRLKCARLYGNRDIAGFGPGDYGRTRAGSREARLTLNVIKSCIDAGAAKISKNRPRALFLTTGGDFQLQERAKDLSDFCEGMFEVAGAYEAGPKVFRDSQIFDTGVMKVSIDTDTDQPVWERVFVDDLRIDEVEARDGEVLQIHYVKHMPPERLLGWFCADPQPSDDEDEGEEVQKLRDADKASREAKRKAILAAISRKGDVSTVGRVTVVESWRVRVGTTPGRHVISIEGHDLFDEEWTHPWLPFEFCYWTPPLQGAYGTGLAEDLIGIQTEINRLLITITEAMKLACVPRVYIDAATQIVKQLTDVPGEHYTYTGRPPVVSTASAMPPEVYQQLRQLVQWAYEMSGTSQLSASSKKPGGLDSGAAIREYQDIETERFILQGQRYEQLFMNATKKSLALLRERVAAGSEVRVKSRTGEVVRTLSLNEIDLPEDQYSIRVWPVSLLPSSPAGKLQTVKEMVKDGFIQDRSQAMQLLDYPDVRSFVSLETAALDEIRMRIDLIQRDQVYIAPDKYMNLQLAQRLVRAAHLRARVDKRPQTVIDLLQQFDDEVVALLEDGNALPAAAAPPPGPPVPMGEGPAGPMVPQMAAPNFSEAA